MSVMTANPDNGRSPAREREHRLMRMLADVLVHGSHPERDLETEDQCLLGYGADLVKGSVEDPDGRLRRLADRCRSLAAGVRVPEDVVARDPVQAAWKARWHLDARKLRLELPLHVQSSTNAVPAGPAEIGTLS